MSTTQSEARAMKPSLVIESGMEQVMVALSGLRIGIVTEEWELQKKIAAILNDSHIKYNKEHQLGPGSRVDFMTESGVAVEVKKGKPNRTRLVDQMNRYAAYDEVKAVVIVVETSLRTPITESANGKPCAVVGLQKLWGIAL